MPKNAERSQIIPLPRSEATVDRGNGSAFRGPQPRRRRTGLLVSLVLVTLAVIVVLADLLIHFSSTGQPAASEQTTVPAGPVGCLVELPYNVSQVNALKHLVDRMNYRELANLYVAHMSLDEKLGQMIMTESEQNNYSDDLDYMITQLHVGGMIMYESHLQTASQAIATTSQAQQRAKIPLLTSVDEEGGAYVTRLEHIYGARPRPGEIYQSGSLDSDQQRPLMRPAMSMSADVLMRAIDPVMPAELSHKFMTDILRKGFGYDGVVLTDALYMSGISAQWSEPQAAVLAIQAGNDMILGPMGSARTAAVIEAFRQALNDGQLSMARVNEAVARIIALKMQYHLMPVTLPRN